MRRNILTNQVDNSLQVHCYWAQPCPAPGLPGCPYDGKAKPLHRWPQHGLSIWEDPSDGHSCTGGPAPLPAGISGIAALNPATGGMVNPNMAPVLDPATVPFQEGWIKLRGIPFAVSKADICAFFSVSHCPPGLSSLLTSFKIGRATSGLALDSFVTRLANVAGATLS